MSDALLRIENADSAQLLPLSMTDDANVRALLTALDGNWHALATALPLLCIFATLDQQPSEVVDRLAYQLHVDYYDFALPLATRRELVRKSIRFHQLAGTRGAVEDLISTIWGEGARLQEWFEVTPPLDRGTFLVILSSPLTTIDITKFLSSIKAVKRATDWPIVVTSENQTDYTIPLQASAVVVETQDYGTFEV